MDVISSSRLQKGQKSKSKELIHQKDSSDLLKERKGYTRKIIEQHKMKEKNSEDFAAGVCGVSTA